MWTRAPIPDTTPVLFSDLDIPRMAIAIYLTGVTTLCLICSVMFLVWLF